MRTHEQISTFLFTVLAVCVISVTVYLNTYYPADDASVDAMLHGQGKVIAAGPYLGWER